MLSDESSSDSETGRFKCRTKNDDENKSQKNDSSRALGRSRHEDRFHRDTDKLRSERDNYDRHPRDRHRFSRPSPPRRRYSRERSPRRRSRERDRPRHRVESPNRPKPREHRSTSKDRRRHSRSRSNKPAEHRRDLKEELKRHLKDDIKPVSKKESEVEKKERKSIEKSPSPDYKGKKSVVHKPTTSAQPKRKLSPIVIKEDDSEPEEVQPGSYYSMIPAVIKDKEKEKSVEKEKSDESSEIDSSDDERLRAKLLNLEKELHKTRKKKHKKKHKRKRSKSSKDRDRELSTVEVTSTTDIDKAVPVETGDSIEVTSTQKSSQKESSEEGEITTDDDSQERFDIDPTDLRHKLKRKGNTESKASSNVDYCGPALPPHLQKIYERSESPEIEGPALPPHLNTKTRNIGPSIPEDMRKVLADRAPDDDVKYVSSDEDGGIGPLPEGAETKWSEAHKKLEERALDIKIRKLEGRSEKSDVKSREQWMLELPEGKAKYLGFEARSFRAREGPDMSDRSSWTDTPEEKARKAAGIANEEDPEVALKREARARHIACRDEEQEKAVKKHKKKHKREESLLEMHEKKLKKKKKKEDKDEKPERRPFSRDVDLQVNRFDEAQKKSIIKKAQALDSRFSRGEAKYL